MNADARRGPVAVSHRGGCPTRDVHMAGLIDRVVIPALLDRWFAHHRERPNMRPAVGIEIQEV